MSSTTSTTFPIHQLDHPTAYHAPGWDYPGTPFSEWLRRGDGTAVAVWHEAQWDDVLFDAYAENERRALATPAPVELSAAERDLQAAQRQAELLGASADQRAKLRTIVEERATAQRELAAARAEIARLSGPVAADDDRLTPIWVSAAEEANRQGYCSVYDGIAQHVGAPSRDELSEMGYLSHDYRVEVRFEGTTYITVEAASAEEAISEVRDNWDYADIAREIEDIDDFRVRSAELSD